MADIQSFTAMAKGWALTPPYEKQLAAVIEIMAAGSDQVVAVTGGALLFEAVDRTLDERLRNDGEVRSKLTGKNRPLDNLGPKIDALYLLNTIDRATRDSMQAMVDIRNAFAHKLGSKFDPATDDIKQAMARLNLHQGRSHYPHHLFGDEPADLIEAISSQRSLFVVNLKLALILLMRNRISHEPYTTQRLTDEEIERRHGDLKRSQAQQRTPSTIAVQTSALGFRVT